jgi:hypothetical protein
MKTSLIFIKLVFLISNLVRDDIHLYSVNDEGTTRKVMVFTQKELEKVKENILQKVT